MTLIIFLAIVEIIFICKLVSLKDNSGANRKFEIDFKFAYFQDLEINKLFFAQQRNFSEEKKVRERKLRARKTFVAENGYVYFFDSHKSVHRWVMEKYLGRKLSYEEVVHHIDGNKQNNKISNLKLFPNQQAHDQYHREHLKNYGTWFEEFPTYPAFRRQVVYSK